MYTKEELEKKPSILLRKIAGELGIKNASKMDKAGMITEIMKAQEKEQQAQENAQQPEYEEVVEHEETVEVEETGETGETEGVNGEVGEEVEEPVVSRKAELVKEDRHGKPLEPGYEVAANINGKWYDGVVDGFKVLDGESYIYITLTKFGKQKMFLQHEVEFKKEGSPKPKPVDVKTLTDLDSADPSDLNAETPAPTTKKGKKEKIVKEKVVKEKKTKEAKIASTGDSGNVTIEKSENGISAGDSVKFMSKGKEIIGLVTRVLIHAKTGKEQLRIKDGKDVFIKFVPTVTKVKKLPTE